MDFNTELNNQLSSISGWLNENKIGLTPDKTKNIVREIFWAAIDNDIKEIDIYKIKELLKYKDFTITKGDLWSRLLDYFDNNDKYIEFFKNIANLTPRGLDTSPNACCGKFELLYRLLRPNSSQPKTGDIFDNGVIYELKGTDVRISDTELTGIEYNKRCTKIFKDHIEGNTVKKGGLAGSIVYEIEKRQYCEHYTKEFGKDITKSKKLLMEYFNINGWQCDDVEINSLFPNDVWDQDIMQKIILKKMFNKYKASKKFDTIYIFGDGTDVKIINTADDLMCLKITSDYFRINQTGTVGWYIL
jgi:hypothetical protein